MKRLIKLVKKGYGDKIIKNSVFLAMEYILSSGLGFLFWLLMARSFSDHDVGIATAIISTVGLISTFSLFGLDEALIKFLPKSKKKDEIFHTSAVISSVLAILFSLIVWFMIGLFSPDLSAIGLGNRLFLILSVSAVIWTVYLLIDAALISMRKTEQVVIKSIIFNSGKIIFALLMIGMSSMGIIYGWYGAAALASIIFLVIIIYPGYIPKFTPKVIKHIFEFSFFSYLTNLLNMSQALLMPILVLNMINPESAAYYYIVISFANLFAMIPLSVNKSLFTEGAHDSTNMKKNLRKSLVLMGIAIVPALMILIPLSGPLLSFFGEGYVLHARQLFIMFAISIVFFSFNETYNSLMKIQGKIKRLFLFFLVNKSLFFAVSIYLMPTSGLEGIGLAWLISNAVMSIVSAIEIKKVAFG